MAALIEFSSAIGKLAANLEKGLHQTAQKVGTSVLRSVLEATPVDTGKARSNWQVGIGTAPPGPISPHSPGKHLGRGERANLNTALSLGKAVIRQFKEGELHIANDTPYINILNTGSSSQNPASNFVEIAARQGIISLQNIKLLP